MAPCLPHQPYVPPTPTPTPNPRTQPHLCRVGAALLPALAVAQLLVGGLPPRDDRLLCRNGKGGGAARHAVGLLGGWEGVGVGVGSRDWLRLTFRWGSCCGCSQSTQSTQPTEQQATHVPARQVVDRLRVGGVVARRLELAPAVELGAGAHAPGGGAAGGDLGLGLG
jgi:hypothetical protein